MPITDLTGHIIPLSQSPQELAKLLARRVHDLRLARGWGRAELAERTGVSEATIKVFERSGQITLSRLLLLARALDALGPFGALFEPPAARSLEELEKKPKTRQRGRRRS